MIQYSQHHCAYSYEVITINVQIFIQMNEGDVGMTFVQKKLEQSFFFTCFF